MPHTNELTESQVRHVDEHRSGEVATFADMTTEGQARHVDEYRHALLVHEESDIESDIEGSEI